MKKKWSVFWEWFFDRDSDNNYFNYMSGRAKAMLIGVFGFIVILLIIFLVIEIDYYFRNDFK